MTSEIQYDEGIHERNLTLMCLDTIVAIRSDMDWEIISAQLVPKNLRLEHDGSVRQLTMVGLSWIQWCAFRTLNIDRVHYKKIMQFLSLDQDPSDEGRHKLSLSFRCVSLDDSYWVKFQDSDGPEITWGNISLRKNTLSNSVALVALTGRTPISLQPKNFDSSAAAEISAQGGFPKGWFREEDDLYLYKGGYLVEGYGDEPLREVCASRVMSCFNVYGQVRYELAEKDGITCSKSKLMTTDEKGIVYARHLENWCRRNGYDFLKYVTTHWLREFSQMVVLDYLLANSDRHEGNWGLWQSMVTGDLLGLHDLYDHNQCFDESTLINENAAAKTLSGKSLKEAAIEYYPTSGLKLVAQPTCEMFPSKLSYETFVKRCKQVGLWYKSNAIVDKFS